VLDFAHVDVPTPLRWVGALLGVGALVLFASAHRALGRNWSGVLEIAHRHTLVTRGPYGRVRHPMYSALLATAVANALLAANWLVALVVVTTVAMYLARVRDEERLMLDYFGDAYRAYMRQTGRVLPKLWP
jgi:protein-S-isoprenylcysteine O-methyltransferase Ste14